MHASRMHAGEPETDSALVRRLVARQFPRWAELPVSPVAEAGTDYALYRLGDELAVRLPRGPRVVAQLEKELLWLPRLAPLLPLPIPVPVAAGEPDEGYPYRWSVSRWLPGEAATGARPAHAADDLAAFVGALQGIDAADGPPPGTHNVWRGVSLAERAAQTGDAVERLARMVGDERLLPAWEDALQAAEWEGPPVWVHGDLDARNVLVRRGRLSAVIDFGCLGVGDPACDAMVAWKLVPAEERAAFREALRIDDATWLRARAWVLSQAAMALTYYTEQTNAPIVHEARRWLAEALDDRR